MIKKTVKKFLLVLVCVTVVYILLDIKNFLFQPVGSEQPKVELSYTDEQRGVEFGQ